MNKLWSILFFAFVLIASWNMIHSSTAVGSETHIGIQAELSTLLLETVQSKKPEIRNLKITRMWTETLEQNKIRAVFSYSFTESDELDKNLERTTEGEAVLYREPTDDNRLDKWILQSVKTTNNSISFSEGTVIRPNAAPDEATVE
jgi:hypothetical protein